MIPTERSGATYASCSTTTDDEDASTFSSATSYPHSRPEHPAFSPRTAPVEAACPRRRCRFGRSALPRGMRVALRACVAARPEPSICTRSQPPDVVLGCSLEPQLLGVELGDELLGRREAIAVRHEFGELIPRGRGVDEYRDPSEAVVPPSAGEVGVARCQEGVTLARIRSEGHHRHRCALVNDGRDLGEDLASD